LPARDALQRQPPVFKRKIAVGETRNEVMRCLRRRIAPTYGSACWPTKDDARPTAKNPLSPLAFAPDLSAVTHPSA